MTDRGEDPGRYARLSAIASAPGAADALERVLDATVDSVPRATLLLVRAGRLRGWRCVRYDDACSRRLERVDLDCAGSWLASLLDPAAPGLVHRDVAESAPDFGQPPADEALATSLRAGGATVALLIAERFRGQEPWGPVSFATLGLLGSMRLELDIVRRRPAPPAAPAPPPPPQAQAPAPAPVEEPPAYAFSAIPPALRLELESGLVPFEQAQDSPPIQARQRDAKRFARLVASDIRLYNEEAVLSGRRQRDLAVRLESALARGRESFLRRFPDLGPAGLQLLDDAYIEVLAGGDAQLLGAGAPARES